jgi:hypothetical protein
LSFHELNGLGIDSVLDRIIRPILLMLALGVMSSGCWLSPDSDSDHARDDDISEEGIGSEPLSVAELRAWLYDSRRETLQDQAIEITAYVTEPPLLLDGPRTPPPGCPVATESLAWLSDVPVSTHFDVAGVTLANRLPVNLPVLRLVTPYRLGFIDVPDHATLRGRLLDEAYARCPNAELLFILEAVVEEHDSRPPETAPIPPVEWLTWSDDDTGVETSYPATWQVEERRGAGAIVRATFRRPDDGEPVRLSVIRDETIWRPGDGMPPDPLRGARQERVDAGPVPARLVDAFDDAGPGLREARFVLNHSGNTVVLSLRYSDGEALDREGLAILETMFERLSLTGEIGLTDPMEPALFAQDEIGDGPFLSETEARYRAGMVSGLIGFDTVDARLVAEAEARRAVPGACGAFEGQPGGVWLVTVRGQSPSGQQVERVVFLDASTGARLCQTEERAS